MSAATLVEIRRTDPHRLSPSDFFLLEFTKLKTDLRAVANTARTQGPFMRQANASTLQYMKGRLHGCWFSFAAQIIYKESMSSYDECEMLAHSAINEASFLCGEYQFEATA